MTYEVRLKTEAPLMISESRATGNDLTTLKHIPGSVWRGGMAASVMLAKDLTSADAHTNADFHALFLDGKTRFESLRQGDGVYPLSARYCRMDPAHGPLDLLLTKSLGKLLPRDCPAPTTADSSCGGKLKVCEGFYYRSGLQTLERTIRTRLTAHAAISNLTLTTRGGQFFTSEVVEADEVFRGQLRVEDDAKTKDAAESLVGTRFLTIGRGATRGQGHASITIRLSEEEDGKEELLSRLRALNERFTTQGLIAFTCTLQSPCLVYDDWLFARSWIATEDLEEAAGEKTKSLGDYELVAHFGRMTTIGGWNSQRGLPKPDNHAIAPGSAFLFTRKIGPEERDAEISRLGCILWKASKGIGEKWEEGFGEAVFCDAFHYTQGDL